MMAINILLLVLMLIASLWTVMGRSLLKATIGLAVTSAALSVIIFRLNSPIAAVFELSVCTGLMTVVFVSTISLTKPLTHKDIIRLSTKRMKRFWYLPVIVIIAAIALIFVRIPKDLAISVAERARNLIIEMLLRRPSNFTLGLGIRLLQTWIRTLTVKPRPGILTRFIAKANARTIFLLNTLEL